MVSGCTKSVARFQAERPDRIGVLVVPEAGNKLPLAPTVYAADNGCFGGLNEPAFLRMVAKLVGHPHRPLWVASPDAVADPEATAARYVVWGPVLRSLGLPVAFVMQDGCERMRHYYPLRSAMLGGDLAAVFVGGSTAWKLSPEAFRLTLEAHKAGLLVHFGRVNTSRRIREIMLMHRSGLGWCDTIDGGSAVRWGDTNIPKLIRWMDEAAGDRQPAFF